MPPLHIMGYYDPPEDTKAEAQAEAVSNALEPLYQLAEQGASSSEVAARAYDNVTLAVLKLLDRAYADGYSDGKDDTLMAEEYRQ